MRVRAIRTERLELISLGPRVLEAVVAGQHDRAERRLGATVPAAWPEDIEWLRTRLAAMVVDPDARQWSVRAMVLRGPDRQMIGDLGFHGPPDQDGMVEIGYGLLPDFRGRGYAIEAARGLIGWAARRRGITRFRACVRPGNGPSLRLVAKLGFVQTGTQIDPIDGEELVHELQMP